MRDLKTTLKSRLKNADRIAILGIGSELRGDDVAGQLVVKQLEPFCCKIDKGKKAKTFNGATAPENITGEIKRFKPSHLIVIDSIDAGIEPGEVTLFEPDKIRGASFSTHRLPASIMTEYLRKSIDCKVVFIGIKPKTLDFCAPVSGEVSKSVKYVSDAIKKTIA